MMIPKRVSFESTPEDESETQNNLYTARILKQKRQYRRGVQDYNSKPISPRKDSLGVTPSSHKNESMIELPKVEMIGS